MSSSTKLYHIHRVGSRSGLQGDWIVYSILAHLEDVEMVIVNNGGHQTNSRDRPILFCNSVIFELICYRMTLPYESEARENWSGRSKSANIVSFSWVRNKYPRKYPNLPRSTKCNSVHVKSICIIESVSLGNALTVRTYTTYVLLQYILITVAKYCICTLYLIRID